MTWKSIEIAPKSRPILGYGVFKHKAEVITSRHLAEIHWSNWWNSWLDPVGASFQPELWAELPEPSATRGIQFKEPVCDGTEPVCDGEEDI